MAEDSSSRIYFPFCKIFLNGGGEGGGYFRVQIFNPIENVTIETY